MDAIQDHVGSIGRFEGSRYNGRLRTIKQAGRTLLTLLPAGVSTVLLKCDHRKKDNIKNEIIAVMATKEVNDVDEKDRRLPAETATSMN